MNTDGLLINRKELEFTNLIWEFKPTNGVVEMKLTKKMDSHLIFPKEYLVKKKGSEEEGVWSACMRERAGAGVKIWGREMRI